MTPPRSVQPEILDHLVESDLRAIRSRTDLRRINRIMGARSIMLRALRNIAIPQRVIELGAGDGTLMLGLAEKLAHRWPRVHLTLLDRQNLVASATADAFQRLGWQVEILNADVLDWTRQAASERYDLVTANLFFHHFNNAHLELLLSAAAERSSAVFACEPRRGRLALAGSHLVRLIGASAVTREDAVLSVRAGFSGNELTALWPPGRSGWHLRERRAGLFSHCFLALRRNT